MTTQIDRHPVQTLRFWRGQAYAPKAVTMAAYEVYCHVYAPQEALVTGECRGGFSTGELIAFLYARSFPKAEWRRRVDEAFKGAQPTCCAGRVTPNGPVETAPKGSARTGG